MNKHRICTTISHKHWELLNKYAEKFETQQKALEKALESLDSNESKKNNSNLSPAALTVEEEVWLRAYRTKSMCIFPKDSLPILFSIANNEMNKEYITRSNTIAYALEYYMMKSLKECSLKEVVNALTIILRAGNGFDTVDCKENDSYYTLILTHMHGVNTSKILSISYEKIFESICIKAESIISEKSIFMKIYKK